MPLNRSVLNSWGCPFTIGLCPPALLGRFWRDENGYHLTAPRHVTGVLQKLLPVLVDVIR